MPNETYEYVLEKFVHLTSNIYQVFLYPKESTETLNFTAGQFVSILYPDGSYQPFSIANAPKNNGEIELHIRCLSEDKNTQAFIEQLTSQKYVRLMGPFGQCVHHDNEKPTLLLAAGTGFAQAKAIIEQQAHQQTYPLMHLYWGVRTPNDFYLTQLIKNWELNFNNFHFTPVISKIDSNSPWPGKIGYIPQLVTIDYKNLENFQVYVSGPKALTDNALEILQKNKLRAQFLYSDML